jgi:flagellar hook-length control protein FliK
VVPFISTNGKSAGVQPQAAKGIPAPQPEINAIADGAISAPQTATQTTDGPQQTPSFAASLEQSSALRGAGTADNVATHLRHQPATQQSPVEQVSVHVGKALADGSSKMEIHLKPAELGRVDVRIETDADGRSHVFVTADKRDTLDMLQRDARGLERALADAGLKADSNSLSFNLRGGDAHQHAQGDNNGRQAKPAFDLNGNYDDLDDRIGESEMALSYDAGRAYRLNIDRGVDISV